MDGAGVSIVGTLLATSALMVGIRRETASWALTWLGGALWLSTYEDSGTFLDLTRADGLMMGLLGWALVLVRLDKLRMAGVTLWLAFLANTMPQSLVCQLPYGCGESKVYDLHGLLGCVQQSRCYQWAGHNIKRMVYFLLTCLMCPLIIDCWSSIGLAQ